MSWLSDLLNKLFHHKPAVRPTPPPPVPVNVEFALLAAHNAARRADSPLAIDPRLSTVARNHAAWMAASGDLTHNGADGSFPARLGPLGYSTDGENIAAGQDMVSAVMQSWLSSPGHRGNIMDARYTAAGFAMVRDQFGRCWWCADFGGS